MTTPKILNALEKYYYQLNRSRRIISVRSSIAKEKIEDRVTLSEGARRKELILRLTREITNNLITSRTPPQVVQEIKEELEKECGYKLFFSYDPKEKKLTVRREDKRTLSEIEQENLLKKLRDITYKKLNSILSP